ncbi:MAG: hypothetical protein KF718_06180 [Polyangiaceae bacterium]|nr:hypothetical protein [Polyangiaceae bacterium]
MSARSSWLLAGLLLCAAGSCLAPEEGGVDGDFEAGTGGSISSTTLHSSCDRASGIDGVYCTSDYTMTYVCRELLVHNGGCRAANGATTLPLPGAVLWCCAPPDAGSGGAGGSGGQDASLGGSAGAAAAGGGVSAGGNGGVSAGGSGGTGGSGGVSSGGSGGTAGCGGATAPLTGTPTLVTTLTGVTQLAQLAVDASHVYIATYTGNVVRRAPVSGGASELVATSSVSAMGITELGANVYFTNVIGEVTRAAKNGSSQNQVASLGSDGIGLTADSSHLYALRLTNPGPLLQIPIGGGTPVPLGTFPVTTRSVVKAPTRFIVGGASVPKLWSMPLTGGTATELVDLGATSGRDVGQLAYDAGKIWVASLQSSEILVVDEACSTVTVARAAADTSSVLGIALNATHVFWASFQDNKVWSLPR